MALSIRPRPSLRRAVSAVGLPLAMILPTTATCEPWRVTGPRSPMLTRPAEVRLLQGDASKARQKIGWTYNITFEQLVCEMVDSDCAALGVQLSHKPSTAR